jgi:hypothetical protein
VEQDREPAGGDTVAEEVDQRQVLTERELLVTLPVLRWNALRPGAGVDRHDG